MESGQKLRLSNLKLEISKATNLKAEKQALRDLILSRLRIAEGELVDFEIWKKSIDARKKPQVAYVYTVDVSLRQAGRFLQQNKDKGITVAPDLSYQRVPLGSKRLTERPVIIGMGPAGLFAGLMLSRNGYCPVILERGEEVDARVRKIDQFWRGGPLDPESNVQFGEGGAGTFSDGKLTTMINDRRCRLILEEFVRAGAPAEILYKSKPHIGTDLLRMIVKKIRHEIIARGGEVRFQAKVSDFIIKDGKLNGLVINDRERLACHLALLGIGHSARDTFAVLHSRGVAMIQKPFSIGVRIEHPQEVIDRAQYGRAAGTPGLGAADYKLVYHSKTGRSAYSFCMCPGGYVVAAASEEGCLVTNGMSEYKRDGVNANSALLVGVGPGDFPGEHPLAGVEFQRRWERLAYEIGGGSYRAPAQLTGDFLSDRPSTRWGKVRPTYQPGVVFGELKECLPPYVIDTLKEAILHFDGKIKGFARPDSILTGVETRSSSPVRITRDDEHLSNIVGLYPMGEGSGYAGGIMSAAVDGIRTAEKVMQKYAPWA